MQSPDRTPVRPSALRNNSANPALLNKEDFDTLLAGINGSATNAFNSSSRTSDPNTTKSPRQYRSPEPSRMLIRRNNNQQLTTRPSSNAIAWPTAPVQSRPDAQATDHVTVDDRQTFARAEAKKKPVAPFVLKLWRLVSTLNASQACADFALVFSTAKSIAISYDGRRMALPLSLLTRTNLREHSSPKHTSTTITTPLCDSSTCMAFTREPA